MWGSRTAKAVGAIVSCRTRTCDARARVGRGGIGVQFRRGGAATKRRRVDDGPARSPFVYRCPPPFHFQRIQIRSSGRAQPSRTCTSTCHAIWPLARQAPPGVGFRRGSPLPHHQEIWHDPSPGGSNRAADPPTYHLRANRLQDQPANVLVASCTCSQLHIVRKARIEFSMTKLAGLVRFVKLKLKSLCRPLDARTLNIMQ